MNFREAVLLVYGLIFATSTPYLKPKKRFMFPTAVYKFDENLKFFLGGSGICAELRSDREMLVVNTNQGDAARLWRDEIARDAGSRDFSVALNTIRGAFGNPSTLRELSSAKSVYVHSDFGESLEPFASFPVKTVTREIVLSIGDETVHLIPVSDAATGSDLVVFFEKRSVMMFGALFNNRIHPELSMGVASRGAHWIAALEELIAKYSPRVCVPGEGEFGTMAEVREFIRYLSSLMDPSVEFSYCRQNFDWHEIPSATSLEENYDILRRDVKTHTSLN